MGLDTSFLVAIEVRSHEAHATARARFQKLAKAGDTFSLTPQILAEFIHVVTDSRRFSAPLTVERAVERADIWWNAAEIVQVFPTAESTLRMQDPLNHRRVFNQGDQPEAAATARTGEDTSAHPPSTHNRGRRRRRRAPRPP